MRLEHLLGPVLIASLFGIGALQYRWIGEVSEAEKARLQTSLTDRAERFASELDQELSRIFVLLARPGPDPSGDEYGDHLFQRLERWRLEARWPGLIKDIFWLSWGRGELLILDQAQGVLVETQWPPELEELRPGQEESRARMRMAGGIFGIRGDIPAIVLPLGFRRGPPARDQGSGGLVILLDQDHLSTEVLPDLAERHFLGGDGAQVKIQVVTMDDPDLVIYQAGLVEALPESKETEFSVDFLRLRGGDELRALWMDEEQGGVEARDRGRRPGGPLRGLRPPHRGLSPEVFARLASPQWRLLVSLQEGSLEQAVTAARRKNLALSASVLLILGVSVLLTIMASRRAQRLERQHVDFVAGVSHELRSPLASIRSAAQNLADGVVQKPEQVERYGQLLDRESRRLGAMVEQVLAYAGVRSETAELKFEAVDVKGLLETALADCQWLLEERGVEPDLRVDEGLPEIWGDADRLRRSLVNLIDNAAKYGAEGGWVRVGALWRSEQQRVELFVEDDGPGFDPALRHRLCDPFVRGGASNIPGSGLGLSLVSKIAELHGAELSLTSSEGGGAKVELRLAPISEKGPDETEDRG